MFAPSAVVAAAPNQAVYQIDVAERGTAFLAAFNGFTINTYPYTPPLVELQTSLQKNGYGAYQYIVNGIVPYVRDVVGTTNNTLLVVTYNLQTAPGIDIYVVVPTEQMSSILYFPTIPQQAPVYAPFNAYTIPNTLPFFFVDPAERAADYASAFSVLHSYKTANSMNQIWIQTTLSVNSYQNPRAPNGLLANVLSVSIVGPNLLAITYRPLDQNVIDAGTVFVTSEQVLGIYFLTNYLYPSSIY